MDKQQTEKEKLSSLIQWNFNDALRNAVIAAKNSYTLVELPDEKGLPKLDLDMAVVFKALLEEESLYYYKLESAKLKPKIEESYTNFPGCGFDGLPEQGIYDVCFDAEHYPYRNTFKGTRVRFECLSKAKALYDALPADKSIKTATGEHIDGWFNYRKK